MHPGNIQSSRETVYFILSLFVSISIYIMAAVSIVGIGIALIIFAFVFYIQLMMLGSIRGNGVRIHQNQFPDVYARVQELSKQMGLKKVPDVFVVQSEGALNAFATRFLGRDMVVLYSEVFDLAREQGQEELDFILAHELAHIKRRHVWKNIAILPAAFVPFLAQAYSRSCEYTCDHHAAYVIQNPQAAKRALTMLGVGKRTFHEVNEDAFVQQIETESNAIVWLTEVLSTHPRLPKRIQSISQFAQTGENMYFPRTGRIVGGVALLTAVSFAIYFGSIALFAGGSFVYGNLFASALEEPGFSEDFGMEESTFGIAGETPLMTAAYEGDVELMQVLLDTGDDVSAKDADGSDPLMYAIYGDNPEAIELLLASGADPNSQDNYSTVLVSAVNYGNPEVVRLLLDYGADPLMAGPDGLNALDTMGATSVEELLDMLE